MTIKKLYMKNNDADLLEAIFKDNLKKISSHQETIYNLREENQRVNIRMRAIENDYHVVIPKSFKSLSEWQKHTGQKHSHHICKNRFEAKDLLICCNVHLLHYWIVKMTDEEIKKHVNN